MEKFHDSVDLCILAEELIQYESPSELLVLGTLAHVAPRILKVGSCISDPIVSTGNSMLAGCQQAVSFARGLLWSLVDRLVHALPRNPVWEHVDDLSQPLTAHSANALRIKLVTAGTIVGEEVHRLKLKLSDKSVVVPISVATQRAAFELGNLVPPVLLRVANSFDDVGVEMSGGRRRMAKAQN